MKDKQKIHFPQRKCPSHWFWIFGLARSPFCSDLAWLCTEASPVARCGYRPVRQHRGGIRGGRGEIGGGAVDTDPSLFLALIGSGRVYCCKQEVGRQGGGGVGWGAAKCLSYRIVLLSLFVCLSSHCRNQFALCGTVDKERERLPGGLFRGNSSKHNQDTWRQKQRRHSNMRNKPNSQKAPLHLTLNFLQHDGCF